MLNNVIFGELIMETSPKFFLISTVLLVPFVYGISFIPDVCAVDPAPGYLNSNTCGAKTTNPETGVTKQTCCWKERTGTSQAPGPEKIVCQTCEDHGRPGENLVGCDAPVTQAAAPLKPELSGTLDEGQIIEGNTTDPDLTQDRLPGGGIFKVPGTNATFAEHDNSSSSSTLAQLQSSVENKTTEEETQEEQNESEDSEDESEEEEE